jgi:hypothetical protein
MLTMERSVEPELLDALSPKDARAARSRRDLRRLNRWMRHPVLMASALEEVLNGSRARCLADLGAGDGYFLARVARELNGRWPGLEVFLVDRLAVFDQSLLHRFDWCGWRVRVETVDALDWLRQRRETEAVVITNLLLHQFSKAHISEIFQAAAQSCSALIALEPRRARWPLFCTRFLGLLGCGAVTCHDAQVSVRAGFENYELSALWPESDGWKLVEGSAGLFSHLFVAGKSR